MRTSRIVAVSILLCVFFAGPSTLLAADEQKVTFGDRNFVVSFDKDKNTVTIAEDKQIKKVVKDQGSVGDLILHKIGEPPQRMDSVSDGCIINSHYNPTCRWVFSGGQWVRECTYP